MIYRLANIEDIEQLSKLLHQLFTQEIEFEPNIEKQTLALNKIISDNNIGQIYVAQENEKILAMVNLLYTISTALGEKVAILEDMIVDKKYRNKNIGSSLLSYALEKLREDGIRRVTLLSDENNTQAHNFYKKFDFKKSAMLPFRLKI